MGSQFLHGNHFSASGINISGSTVDVIATVEGLTGASNIVAKKLFISNGSVINKVMLNSNSYWCDMINTSGSYSLSFGAGDVLISNLYLYNASGSKLTVDMIY
jgi:hypothetical protein